MLSRLFSNGTGLWAPGASVGQQLWLEEPPFLDSLEVNEIGGGVCESALKLLHKSEGLQVYARVRTLLGKSDRSGSQGGPAETWMLRAPQFYPDPSGGPVAS